MKPLFTLILGACLLGLAVPSASSADKAAKAAAKQQAKPKPKAAARQAGKQGAQAANLLARFDRNGNGVLDADEKDAVRQLFVALKAYDTNNDGKLDDSELAKFQVAKRQKKKVK